MRSGTPGFIGGRLQQAREARGITRTSLADLLGVSRQSIALYETGKNTPSPELLEAITTTLRLTSPFFLRPMPERGTDTTIAFRSMSSARKVDQLRAVRRFEWVQDIFHEIEQYIDFPNVTTPDYSSSNPLSRSLEEVEEIADEVREKLSLAYGPIPNVVRMLEHSGVVVTRDSLGDWQDAYSGWSSSGRPFIVLGNDKGVAVRSRYDAAHELGHLVLHQRVEQNLKLTPAVRKELELQAHRFAGAFLLPSRSFSEEVYGYSLDAFRALKPRWRVSIAMMIKRASDLNWLSEDAAQRMWIQLSRRGWRKEEPLDDSIDPEVPSIFREALDLASEIESSVFEQMQVSLCLPTSDIESLAFLPQSYFSNEFQRSIVMKRSVQSPESVGKSTNRSAEIIRLPERRN